MGLQEGKENLQNILVPLPQKDEESASWQDSPGKQMTQMSLGTNATISPGIWLLALENCHRTRRLNLRILYETRKRTKMVLRQYALWLPAETCKNSEESNPNLGPQGLHLKFKRIRKTIHHKWKQKKKFRSPRFWDTENNIKSIYGDFDFWKNGVDILFPIPLLNYN